MASNAESFISCSSELNEQYKSSRTGSALNAYNETSDQDQIVCVYPMSGQYGLLARILYYGLLIFSVFNTKKVWLIAGALASALTYSATAAVHGFILAIISNDSLLDVDAFGIWAVVSVGCVAVYPVREWSSTLQRSPARPVFGFWGTLVTVGSICSAAAILRDYTTETKCLSSGGALLDSPNSILDPSFSCTYSCFSTRQALRDPSEIVVLTKERLFGDSIKYFIATFSMTMISGAAFGLFACCSTKNRRTEAELKAEIKANTRVRDPYGRPALPTKYERNRVRALKRQKAELKALQEGKEDPRAFNCYRCFAAINPLLFIIVIVLNEVYILGHGALPVNEASYAIGQWGPLVGVALALVSSWIVKSEEPATQRRLEQIAKEKEERDKRLAEKKKADELKLAEQKKNAESTEATLAKIETIAKNATRTKAMGKKSPAEMIVEANAERNEMADKILRYVEHLRATKAREEALASGSSTSIDVGESAGRQPVDSAGADEESDIELSEIHKRPHVYARSLLDRDIEAGLDSDEERLRNRSRGTW